MYFKKFPEIYYQFDINGVKTLKVVKDVTANIRFRKAILENITLFDEYDLKEGDTPEIVAAKYYGVSEYHWIVMLCNQRFDWVNDFPLGYHELEAYIADKYVDPYGVHHYVDDNGFIISADQFPRNEVTNYQYEEAENEKKRRIKLISPDLLATVVNQFKTII